MNMVDFRARAASAD